MKALYVYSFFLSLALATQNFAMADAQPEYTDRPETPAVATTGQVNLTVLRDNETAGINPYGDNFNYAVAFQRLNVEELKAELVQLLRNSQDFWPADYGHYGPFFIRLSWHSGGTYRAFDGRDGADGGQIRFGQGNWRDNGNLDKAIRLLEPLKQKYGDALSWADLIVLAGTVGLEDMGFPVTGFAFGRADDWTSEEVSWRQNPANSETDLIYVNPEGIDLDGNPHRSADEIIETAREIREKFARMGMNDRETVALIAGGHTFGRAHGAETTVTCGVGESPATAPIEQLGLGWINTCGQGGNFTVTSGLHGAWTPTPVDWNPTAFLDLLLNQEWVETRSPQGALQWIPVDPDLGAIVPDPHEDGVFHAPIMLTSDLALRYEATYLAISQDFLANPEKLEREFAEAWFKLTHRDMGPKARYLGPDVPAQDFIWQDPVPAVEYSLVDEADVAGLKTTIKQKLRLGAAFGLSTTKLVKAAWASAATFRSTDNRGGANGARVQLEPQKSWAVNDPEELMETIGQLQLIQGAFNTANYLSGKQISLADLIVLAGAAGVEAAAEKAGYQVVVPFTPGRTDATQEQTDVNSFSILEPTFDAFRNYFVPTTHEFAGPGRNPNDSVVPDNRNSVDFLVERAEFLNLTVPEMTALLGGLRVLNANAGSTEYGVFTDRPGQLSNDFFVNLLDRNLDWDRVGEADEFQAVVIGDEEANVKWRARAVDLVFGSNPELKAVSESYIGTGGDQEFLRNFVEAWVKVMTNGRFDLY